MSTVPGPVMMEVANSMLEGALKYGRHNYRAVGVRASVYYDAFMRHMVAWWEGEDEDPETCDLDDNGKPIQGTGVSHVIKAITCLVVLRDSMIRGNWVDDRPPRVADGWMQEANKRAAVLIEKYPDPKRAYTQVDKDWADAQ